MKVYDVLKEYKALLDEGVITEEEFEKKKKELLSLPDFGEEDETRGKLEDERKALEEHRRKLKEASLEEKRKHLEQLEEEERQRNAEREQEENPVDAEWEPAEGSDYFGGDTGEVHKKKVKMIAGIVIAAVVVALLILMLVAKNNKAEDHGYSDDTDYNAVYEWPNSGLATSIPKPSIETGEISNNDNTMFDFYLYQASASDYSSYVKECQDSGYTEEDDTGSDYSAYNEEKDRHLEIDYYDEDDTMYIVVRAPGKWDDIYWPSGKIAKTLPKPDVKLYGEISWDDADGFDLDIANVTKADFNAYVDACIKAGYDVDYSRYDDSFSAENKNGIDLDVRYEYFNVMNISVMKW